METTGAGALDTQWKPNPNSVVSTLEISGGKIYIGGSFTLMGGKTRNRLAAVDATGTGAVDTLWDPNASASMSALTVSGNTVYLAGDFTTIGVTPRTALAAVNTTNGALDPWTPSVDKNVFTLASGTKVYMGGNFTTVGRDPPGPPWRRWMRRARAPWTPSGIPPQPQGTELFILSPRKEPIC